MRSLSTRATHRTTSATPRRGARAGVIDDATWAACKARQAKLHKAIGYSAEGWKPGQAVKARRPKYLFSGFDSRCATCGGGFVMVDRDVLGCHAWHAKGTCDNRRRVKRQELEDRVLTAFTTRFLAKANFDAFCIEFTKEANRLRMEQRTGLSGAKRDLERTRREIEEDHRRHRGRLRRSGVERPHGPSSGEEGRIDLAVRRRRRTACRYCIRTWRASTSATSSGWSRRCSLARRRAARRARPCVHSSIG